ncbi:tRNA-splicing endonuclease subunit Sen34 isoform X1 [Acanthopagrus latus]|uniref:tRNA-splicing endonuclease subunit Sen34 isoform X1 n=1 Tax=Acanthopagrus latus TaxID=8177 RepID=UPI00187C3E1B|nr:tRNA-splicing endonuclease subunit Sen34 isoform X1 [Acanthopagrus latus]XP_036937190.1 tRNA-splicing endonuclease subunit Sen34 isoform X1 [Acanthopagrus latus]XP_036937199.1 tRNA-splicing endonuclease subunit Sen34 isoform X1 [Acanthopagrus latus]
MDEDFSSRHESPPPPHVVGVSLCDSTPLLWRVEDLRSVRAQGLVGVLLGSLPRTPRQNGRLGRPLLLLPEEERLLRERHAAAALPARRQDGGGEELVVQVEQQQEEEQQRSYEEQSVLALEDRKSALLRAMTSSHSGGPGSGTGSEASDEALRGHLEDLDRSFTFPQSVLAVQLSTARAGLSYCPEARAFLQADWPIREQHGSSCDARYQVFRDLRERGFYLTSAGKFGGDFLVYPGDPLRFHAHFIAICSALDESVCVLDVLSAARLGSNVKKTVLLCSPGTDGHILYTSLQWSGMV